MSNSSYNILVNGEVVDSKSKKDRAVEVAEALRGEHPTDSITVETSAGLEVHTVKVKGTHARPWTRTETHDGIEVEVPNGYVVAYTRKRVGAVVARSEGKDGWLVLTEDGSALEAANTKEAREITNSLASEHRTKQEAAKLAAAEARALAKQAREKERAAKAEARELERQEKAAAREATKAAKLEAKAEGQKATEQEAEADAAEVEAQPEPAGV